MLLYGFSFLYTFFQTAINAVTYTVFYFTWAMLNKFSIKNYIFYLVLVGFVLIY